MSAAALPRVRFTRDDVDQITVAGLFVGRRFELIDGDLIDKMGQNPPHFTAIQFLLALLAGVFGLRRVRAQGPMEVATADRKFNFPEPDLAVTEAKFAVGKRHPRGDETVLVAEVADTTLRGDSTVKRDLYARAGVPEYWILNLKARKLIVHRHPEHGKYGSVATLTSSESISIAGHSIGVTDMLP